jgi:hypothetical protein
MDVPTNPSWWPARLLRQNPLRKIFACDRQLHPPLYSHVVNFPRLEIPLRGLYKNQIEIGNEIAPVTLRPGTACSPRRTAGICRSGSRAWNC